jgi:hypothetical protein
VDLVKLQSRQLKSGWEKENIGIEMGKIFPFLSLIFLLPLTGPEVYENFWAFLFFYKGGVR